jgi:hypothetical protein
MLLNFQRQKVGVGGSARRTRNAMLSQPAESHMLRPYGP